MSAPATPFARFLATPEPVSADRLAELWADREVTLRLDLSPARLPPGFGAHVRRSFLAALAPGASVAARTGRPCDWDPPCALDVFLREQLRLGGDGLPKPYVVLLGKEDRHSLVTLRVFGTALDWFAVAAEALVSGLCSVLPWTRLVPGLTTAPTILDRTLSPPLPPPALPEGPLRLNLTTPLDMTGARERGAEDPAARIAARMVRRVDAMARWQGQAMLSEETAQLTAAAHRLTTPRHHLIPGTYHSPNARAEARSNPVVSGWLDIAGDTAPLAPILRLAARTHLGRHTNEGLGVLSWQRAE